MAAALSTILDEELLRASSRLHNEYPLDTDMAQVDMASDEVNELCKIITKYGYQRYIRLRLLHRHLRLPEDKILLERSIPQGYLTEPTLVQGINLDEICGQIFSARNGALFPTIFRHSSSSLALDGDFSAEFTQALLRNRLDATLGIEVARDGKRHNMVEFSSDSGSILIDEEKVNLAEEGNVQYTGWVITDSGVVDQAGETRCHVINGKHTPITMDSVAGIESTVVD